MGNLTPLETLDQEQKASDATMKDLKAHWADEDAALAAVRTKAMMAIAQDNKDRDAMRVALGGTSVDATTTTTPVIVATPPATTDTTPPSVVTPPPVNPDHSVVLLPTEKGVPPMVHRGGIMSRSGKTG